MGTSIVGNSDIVEVIRGQEYTDEYNRTEYDFSHPTVVASGRASIQDFLTTEDDTDRQTTTEGLRLISDDPALFNVLLPTDRIKYVGIDYEVDAPIQGWRLFNKLHHIEVYLKRVVG
jgi:hypothetical protein